MGTIRRRSQDSWDGFFYSMAMLVASRSKDPDRQVGAVLATQDHRQVSIGYNGLPAHVPDDPEVLCDWELKSRLVLHAERNCLVQAPFSSEGASLYATRFPCSDCAVSLVLAGVCRLVCPPPDFGHLRWGKSWADSAALLLAAGVSVHYVEEGE